MRWRCRFGLHSLVYEYMDVPHPLTPVVRMNWQLWHCRYCPANGADLVEYKARDEGTATAAFLIVMGALFLIVLGGILDTV